MLTALFIIVTVTSLTSVLSSGGSRILLRGRGVRFRQGHQNAEGMGVGHPSQTKNDFCCAGNATFCCTFTSIEQF